MKQTGFRILDPLVCLFSRLAFVVFSSVLLLGAACYLGLAYFGKGLPDYRQLLEYNPSVVSRLYAKDGQLIDEYSLEHRLYVPISSIPQHVIHAFICAEDRNFYTNAGIDIQGLVRASLQNILHFFSNKRLVGASTITQQVVKNFLLSNERSLSRKVKEAILAYRVSKTLSKDRILELYLNEIYLGHGSYGVASAALNYFNKSLDKLNLEEAALLAALPKAPSQLDPRRNYKRAKLRRNWVIKRMYEQGFVTQEVAMHTMKTPIDLQAYDGINRMPAHFFAEHVRRELIDLYGEKTIYEAGISVHTTLDEQFQTFADKSLRDGLEAYDKRHGFRGPLTNINIAENAWHQNLLIASKQFSHNTWDIAVVLKVSKEHAVIGLLQEQIGRVPLGQMRWARASLQNQEVGPAVTSAATVLAVGDVVWVSRVGTSEEGVYTLQQVPKINGAILAMDPHSGRVLAMSGGYDFSLSQFNRATQALRQPGSAFKPFVYLAALENGFTPASMLIDEEIFVDQGPNLPIWKPKNYAGNFLGPMTLRAGLERSRNVLTVKLALSLGLDRITEVAERFGINRHLEPLYSTVLGSVETTLLDLTNAYAMLVNGGKKVTPSFVERIQDRNGHTIYARDKRSCKECVINSANTESQAQRLLPEQYHPPVLEDQRDLVTDARSAYQLISMLQGAVQRGTARRLNTLSAGLGAKTGTTNDSVDTWTVAFSPNLVVGVFVGFDQPVTLGEHETATRVALPIAKAFLEKALEHTPSVPFRVPKGIQLVKVDRKTGLLPSEITRPNDIIIEAFKTGTAPSTYSVEYFTEEGAPWSMLAPPRSMVLPESSGHSSQTDINSDQKYSPARSTRTRSPVMGDLY